VLLDGLGSTDLDGNIVGRTDPTVGSSVSCGKVVTVNANGETNTGETTTAIGDGNATGVAVVVGGVGERYDDNLDGLFEAKVRKVEGVLE
jgi:uncharacterized RmlC-like cupin family protein